MGVVPAPPVTMISIPSMNYSHGRNAGVYLEAVCVHTTGGGNTLESLDNWFTNPAAGVSTWFGIGPTASGNVEIHQYVQLEDTAYAHGIVAYPTSKLVVVNAMAGANPNSWCIACEMVDGGIPGNHGQAQRDLLAWLYAWVWENEIAPYGSHTGAQQFPNRERVIGHCEIDSVNRAACPSWPEAWYAELIEHMTQWLTSGAG